MSATARTTNGRTQRLAGATLPIMRETARELRRLLGLGATRIPDLQNVLLSDPGAAIAVFRELGNTRPDACEQVTDAAHAISLIGLDAFRRTLDRLPEVTPLQDRRGGSGPAGAYSQAAHAAYYAGALADRRQPTAGREIPTAALLQNPAILALWVTEPESAQRASFAVRDGVPASVAFGAELGQALDLANRQLADSWRFPRLARLSMDAGDEASPRSRMVRLADDLAQSTAAGWCHDDHDAVTERLSEFLDMSRDATTAWLHRLASDAARELSRFDYPLPGFELMFMPGELDGEDDHDIPVMGRQRPPVAPVPDEPATPVDLHTAIGDIMRRIRRDAGAARVVFAMLNRERSRLRTRLALGGEADDGLRRLDLDLSQMNLFTALMGKPQSVWLNPGNAPKYRSYLPASLAALLCPDGAYLMSLFVNERPLGLLYGDGDGLSEQGYRLFRELCNEATTTLAAGSRVTTG